MLVLSMDMSLALIIVLTFCHFNSRFKLSPASHYAHHCLSWSHRYRSGPFREQCIQCLWSCRVSCKQLVECYDSIYSCYMYDVWWKISPYFLPYGSKPWSLLSFFSLKWEKNLELWPSFPICNPFQSFTSIAQGAYWYFCSFGKLVTELLLSGFVCFQYVFQYFKGISAILVMADLIMRLNNNSGNV